MFHVMLALGALIMMIVVSVIIITCALIALCIMIVGVAGGVVGGSLIKNKKQETILILAVLIVVMLALIFANPLIRFIILATDIGTVLARKYNDILMFGIPVIAYISITICSIFGVRLSSTLKKRKPRDFLVIMFSIPLMVTVNIASNVLYSIVKDALELIGIG